MSYRPPPLIFERQVFISSGMVAPLYQCCRYGRLYIFTALSAFPVLMNRSHRVNPTLVCFLLLLPDPCPLSLSFGPTIIPKSIFNNQGNDKYEMRKKRLYESGYLLLEIRFCLIGYDHDSRDSIRDSQADAEMVMERLNIIILAAIATTCYLLLFISNPFKS